MHKRQWIVILMAHTLNCALDGAWNLENEVYPGLYRLVWRCIVSAQDVFQQEIAILLYMQV